MQNDFSFRIMLVGNTGVGKSSLLLRYAEGNFRDGFLPTVGVDFKLRTVEQAGTLIRLQLWDTPGQNRLAALSTSCMRRAHGLLVVFDLTDRRSFEAVRGWARVGDVADRPQVRVLVGNKSDLMQREVTYEEAEALAKSQKMAYFQVSAKANINVEEAFSRLASQMKQVWAEPYIAKYKKTQAYLLPLKGEGKYRSSCF